MRVLLNYCDEEESPQVVINNLLPRNDRQTGCDAVENIG